MTLWNSGSFSSDIEDNVKEKLYLNNKNTLVDKKGWKKNYICGKKLSITERVESLESVVHVDLDKI